MVDQQGFVLTKHWRDTPSGVELEFWVSTMQGPVKLVVTGQRPVFFVSVGQVSQVDKLLAGYNSWSKKHLRMQDFKLNPVVGYYFQSQRALRRAREHLLANDTTPLESDINPCDRFLMERFIRGGLRYQLRSPCLDTKLKTPRAALNPIIGQDDYLPEFTVLSLDIETAMQGLKLYSVGVYAESATHQTRKVFMVADAPVAESVEVFSNEKELLCAFLSWLEELDPDIIVGWNIVDFDFWFLQRICEKHQVDFRCGRGRSLCYWRKLDDEGARRALTVPGRVILDGIELLKSASYQFESFSLNAVAKSLLGEEKLISSDNRGHQITDLYLADKSALANYNIQDCKLVWDIFEKTKLLDFAIARSRLTGLSLDRMGGSVASFDFRYLPILHRSGFVAPNGHWVKDVASSPGGFVMESRPGIYNYVAVLDFKSLYPSIIRSFKIDPMGMALGLGENADQVDLVPGFKGAWFSKANNILPGLIAELWQSRDCAKADNNAALSQAIKILMNSFYGVLGSAGCRFFDPRLASSITQRGHQIIQKTAEYIEQQGWSVIYGDTDSVFVWLKNVDSHSHAKAIGIRLAEELNQWWSQCLERQYGVESALEIEFETLYQRFLMPTVRGSDLGSKKRYAGVVLRNNQPELVFKGLENVRTDWTRLARDFQSELYRRIFFGEPYREYIKSIVMQVLEGKYDEQLVYRKRLRRKLSDYQRNIPPHVQAARKAASAGAKIRRSDWVEYMMTMSGPEPVGHLQSTLDYQHYIDRQLAPVADSILYFLDESLATITDQQMNLFE